MRRADAIRPYGIFARRKAHIVPQGISCLAGEIGRLTPHDMFAERKHEILPRRDSTICFLSQARYAAHAARREVEVDLPYNAAGG